MSAILPGRARSPSGPHPPTRTSPHPALSTPIPSPRISTSLTNTALPPVASVTTPPCHLKARPSDAPYPYRTGKRSRQRRAESAFHTRRPATTACTQLRSSASHTKPRRSSRRSQAAIPARFPRQSRPVGRDHRARRFPCGPPGGRPLPMVGRDHRARRRRSSSSHCQTQRKMKATLSTPPSQRPRNHAARRTAQPRTDDADRNRGQRRQANPHQPVLKRLYAFQYIHRRAPLVVAQQ